MRVKLKNANIIDSFQCTFGDVTINGGMIEHCKSRNEACDYEVDLHGLALLPAFADTHCHLRDPGQTYKEDMESGMRAALRGGYTCVCAMANTSPVISTAEAVRANLEKAKELKLCKLVQACAAGENLKDIDFVDFATASAATRVMSNDGNTIFSDAFMRGLLEASAKYDFVISTHCVPETEIVKRDLKLLAEVGGNLHIGHISLASTLDEIKRAKDSGLAFTCEVTAHHLFGYECDYKVNPSLATARDVAALIEGTREGYIDCLCTDHAPHSSEDKQKGMAGISGIEYAFSIFNKVFAENGISTRTLCRMLSLNPRKVLKMSGGKIEQGNVADLVAVDLTRANCINAAQMTSRSHNTPFDGRQTLGEVVFTMSDGIIKFSDGELDIPKCLQKA
ncbi:MAG: amidohydrolase family protein [Clostridia bacterium]|nr:amidohydrolase family protein [Clostridia bacterium]